MADTETRVERFDKTKAPSGYRTWTGERKGQKIRVMIPKEINDPKDIKPFFDREYARRNPGESSVKEVSGDPLGYANKVLESFPGAIGRIFTNPAEAIADLPAFSNNPRDQFGGPPREPQGPVEESIPVLGSIVRAAKGTASPEEMSDTILNSILAASGSGIAHSPLGGRVSRGLESARTTPEVSTVGRYVGGGLGALAGGEMGKLIGGEPGYLGAYPGYKLGELAGGKIPPMISAFKRGFSENPNPYIGLDKATPTPVWRTPLVEEKWQIPKVEEMTPEESFNPRLKALEEQTRTEGSFSKVKPEESSTPKETPPEKKATGTHNLSDLKDLAKKRNESVDDVVKQFKDAGFEVKASPKIRRRK